MTVNEAMDHVWLGNPVSQWVLAFGIFLVVVVVLWPIKKWIVGRAKALATETDTPFDDMAVQILKSTRFVFVALLGLWAGSRVLALPDFLFHGFEKAAIIVVVVQSGIWASKALGEWLRIVSERRESDGQMLTWISGVHWTGRIIIWAVALLIALENLGVDVTGLVAGLGIGGIAVALAVQSILGDLFSAYAIFIDRPFVIGDFLKVGDQMGTVEYIGMKTTRLRSLTGEQLVFGNSDLVGSRIQNFGRLEERRASFTVGVTYDTAREKVERIPAMIREAVEAQENVRFDRAHFKEFGDSALIFETVYFVLVPDFAVKMSVQQAINLQLMGRFEDEGIEFAFPSQTIYLETEGAEAAST